MNATAGPSRLKPQHEKSFADTWPVDMNSPFLITQATGVGGATIGATYGVVKSLNPFQVSLRMGAAWGFVFFQFFALREYVVSPLLLRNGITNDHKTRYDLLRDPANNGRYPASHGALTTSEMNTQRLADSAATGFLSGAILKLPSSSYRLTRVIPAGITGMMLATTAQYLVNRLKVTRLNLLAMNKERDDELRQNLAAGRPPPASTPGDIVAPTQNTTARLLPVEAERRESAWIVMDDPTKPVAEPAKSLPARIMGVASAILPVRSLSDQEYLDVLLKKQAGVEKRLAEIAAEEERLFERGAVEEAGDKVW